MLKSCPDPVDVTDLFFKLQCHLAIFENNDASTFSDANSLLTCASRYGLLFVGTNSKHFQVIQTQKLCTYNPKDKDVTDYSRRNINLPSIPKHLCVNCDNTILAVVVEKDQCPVVIFYEVLSFFTQEVKIIKEIRLSSTPYVYIREINWNPALPAIFTACKSDGTLGVYELNKELVDINELPAASGATCFCWSPKGKQIAVGSKDGKITQYKPDLKAVKIINEPQLEDPHSLISLQWVSNYQFIGVYQSMKPEGSSCVIVIDAPKTGEPAYTNYDDICYSGSSRPPQYYLVLQSNWNFLMVSSANSSEVVVLGNMGDAWTQWIMPDTARAELPLSSDHQETLPVGLTFDVSPTTPLPWGESSIPPCPLLCILSDRGILCVFNVVYLKEGIPSVCTPPDSVNDTSGLSSFVTSGGNNTAIPKIEESKPVQLQSIPKDTSQSIPKTTFQFTAHIQDSPLVTGKVSSDISSKNLIGTQSTLTPIKSQLPIQGVPLFGGQTLITPVSKTFNATANQLSNLNNQKYASIFSSLNPTTLTSTSTVPVKPRVISATVAAPKSEVTIKSQENIPTKVLEVLPPKDSSKLTTPDQESQIIDPKLKTETSAMLSQMIRDEWIHLEAELKVLVNQGRALKINLGSDEEKVYMITQLEYLQEFVKEAVEISVGQISEIHYLKQNLIQAWAWFEEANSYYTSSKNEAVALLLKLQPLDSVSHKRLKDIEQLIYYIESQLSQANKALDEQWGNFQDYAKKTHRIQMPTMEAIFQTMVRQSAILQRQTYVLKDISMRLKKKTFGVSSLLRSLDKAENLADDLKELHLDADDILQLQYEKIKKHSKILSNKKTNMLRTLLKQREVTHITANKPQFSSWTMNQSPANRMGQSISILGAQMSPVSKSPVAKNLSFVQSTPVKVSEASKPTQVSQGLSLKHTETSASNILPASSGFVSLAKGGGGIRNSQGSAFAPIGLTSTTSTFFDSQQFLTKTSMPFSFGNTSANTNVSQVKPSFSMPSIPSTTTTIMTTTSEQITNLGGTANPLFKTGSEYTTVKPHVVKSTTATPSFSFSFSSGTPKSAFGAASSTTNSLSTSNSIFSTGSSTMPSSVFDNSNAQTIKPITVVTTSNIFGSQQSSFVSLSKSASVTTLPTAVSTSTPPRTSSGVASIFANLQSVIDKATGSSGASVTSVETSKPAFSFSLSSGTPTTSAQSLFVSTPSTSTTKSAFGTTTLSTSGGLFGNISKSSETVASNVVNSSIFGNTANSPIPIISSTSKPETNASGTPSLSTNSSESTKDSSIVTATITTTTATIKGMESPTHLSTTQITTVEQKSTSLPSSTLVSQGISPAISTISGTPSIFNTSATSVPKSVENIFVPASTSTTTTTGPPETTSAKLTSAVGLTVESGAIAKASSGANTIGTSTLSKNIFGTPSAFETPNTSSVFGAQIASSTVFGTSTTSPSIFETPTISSSAFGTQTTSSVFGAPTTSSSVFDSQTTSSNTFGTPNTSSIFGAPTTSSNVYGVQTTSSSIFGTPTTSNVFGISTTSSNMFGTSGSIFGSTPVSSSSNIFGTQTTTNSSVFGTPTTTSAANIFGGMAPASTTSNIFASSTTASMPFGTQKDSLFGTPKTTGNVFGQQGSFGSQATTASSIFGQPATFGSGSSGFGSSTTTTSGNIFGTATSSSNQFGSGFGPTTSTNTFGSQTTSQAPGSFGFGSLSVDGTASSTGSIFGGTSSGSFGTTQPANPFGKTENKSPFGSGTNSNIFGSSTPSTATTNIFGNPATTASSIFGSSSGATFGASNTGTGFGSPSTFGSSTFGQKPVFGQQTTFGSNTFGSPQPGSFSGGGASPVAQSGFGAPAAFQKSSGFGNSPVFGGGPAFGAAASFGGAPAFGSAPTFGSPEKVFGSSQTGGGGFAPTAAQQNTGFGSLASQNTVGFGSLAQQSNTPSTSPFSSANSSFSSWR